MSPVTYMLDTNICSFIMRKRPDSVLEHLEKAASLRHHIVISAISYAEMRFGATSTKASPTVTPMINAFVARLDDILPWDATAVDQTAAIRGYLARKGAPIGNNDAAIAGHAVASGCVLVTNNTREFSRVPRLVIEDWLVRQ
jgi:tRNA(fMet)-specific endonuclease VapC